LTRHKLFKKSVKSLQSISDLQEEYYVCPLCLRGFKEEAIKSDILTFEHVPQKSIGGKKLLLTCDKCNSEAGYKFESDLHKRERVKSFVHALVGKEEFEGRIKLTLGGVKTNTKIKIKDGSVRFEIPEMINNPKKREQQFNHLQKLVDEQITDYKFNVEAVDRFSKNKVKVSYLKSAYLAAFAALGYGYILRKELDIVRKQIQNPQKDIIPQIFLETNKKHTEEQTIIDVSSPIKSILVHINRTVVLLPPVENGKNSYNDIVNFVKNKSKQSTLTGIELGWPSKLEFEYDNFLKEKLYG